MQFTGPGNFHRAHESLANTLWLLLPSPEVIHLKHLNFYTLKLRVQQDSPGKLRDPSYSFQKVQGTRWSDPSTYQECAISKKMSLSYWLRGTPGSLEECALRGIFSLHASGFIRCGCSVAHQVDLSQEATLLSNGGTCSSLVCELPAITWMIKTIKFPPIFYLCFLYPDAGLSISQKSETTGRKDKLKSLNSLCLAVYFPHSLFMGLPGIFQLSWKIRVAGH